MIIIKKIIKKFKKILIKILKEINGLKYYKNKKYINNKINNIKPTIDKKISIKNISTIDIKEKNIEKYVGGVLYNNFMYCIPNKEKSFLKIDLKTYKQEYIDFKYKSNTNDFLWTGGCIYNDKIYGFSRTANNIICLNLKNKKISYIDLKTNYMNEHHYGGVCTKDGILYQPPRNNNTILVVDLNKNTSREIIISPKIIKYDYVTGLITEDNNIYFIPNSKGKVMVLNIKNEKITFIGKNINCSVFGPCFGPDGNIYGFSSYDTGILKIDIKNNTTEMIHKEIGCPGCFGNKLGINGNIYGIPGNGKYIWEYNVIEDKIKIIKEISDEYAKCAGGVVASDGTIYTTPACGNKIYKFEFNKKVNLKSEQLNSIYYSDNY